MRGRARRNASTLRKCPALRLRPPADRAAPRAVAIGLLANAACGFPARISPGPVLLHAARAARLAAGAPTAAARTIVGDRAGAARSGRDVAGAVPGAIPARVSGPP